MANVGESPECSPKFTEVLHSGLETEFRHHCPTTRPNERKRVRETSEGAKPPSESRALSYHPIISK